MTGNRFKHTPVLLKEVLKYISPAASATANDTVRSNAGRRMRRQLGGLQARSEADMRDLTFVDATFGGGGYTRAILERFPQAKVIAIDQDPAAIQEAKELADIFRGRVLPVRGKFGNLVQLLEKELGMKGPCIDGIVFDVGVSSYQIDKGHRGFSIKNDGPLAFSQEDLANIIYEYGDEKKSRKIARAIVEARKVDPIQNTARLAQAFSSFMMFLLLESSLFQFQLSRVSLRIYVNDEMNELRHGLSAAELLLRPQGTLVTVTFHSLEDGIVKQFLRKCSGTRPGPGLRYYKESGKFGYRGIEKYRRRDERELSSIAAMESALLEDVEKIESLRQKTGSNDNYGDTTGSEEAPGKENASFLKSVRKPVVPTDEEVDENPRARSAKLRAAVRTANGALSTRDEEETNGKNGSRFKRRQDVSFLSRWTFSYIDHVIRRGNRLYLGSDDWALNDDGDDSELLAKRILDSWGKELANKGPEKASLAWSTLKEFRLVLAAMFFLFTFEELVILANAQILSLILAWFKDENRALGYGFMLSALLSLTIIVPALLRHVSRWIAPKFGTHLRIGFIAVIYKKCMKLSISHTSSSGYIVNLLANDLNRFEEASIFFLFIILGPLFLCIATYLIYLQIGSAAFVASGVTLLLIPAQSLISRKFGAFRRASVAPRDSRLKFVSDMLNGIMMVKLYAWEKPLIEKIDTLRREEIRMMRKAAILRAINLSLYQTFSCIAELFAFGSYFLMGGVLTPQKVFTTVALLQSLRWNMGLRFPSSLQFSTEAMVSFRRIQAFLLLPEIEQNLGSQSSESEDQKTLIRFENCSLGWAESPLASASEATAQRTGDQKSADVKLILKNITLQVSEGKMLAVVGPVGAGKSSLLNAILREMHCISGKMFTRPNLRIAYAAQMPWILSGTIRENILFGMPLNEDKMKKVIFACALERDLELFEDGLDTVVGERGITLSGGQKSRVALARACYSDADLILMDDPLSAVDAKVGRHIFDHCINGHLKGRARILVTHQLQYLSTSDSVLLLENGSVSAFGSYDEVQRTASSFSKIMHEYSLDTTRETIETEVQDAADAVTLKKRKSASAAGASAAKKDEAAGAVQIKEEAAKGSVSLSVYRTYFQAGSSLFLAALVFLAFVAGQILLIMTDWWLGQWSSQTEERQKDAKWGGAFIGFVLVAVFVLVTRSLAFFVICLRSSLALSQEVVQSVFAAEMRFFIENPTGRIINRMSSDLNRVDENLPWTLFDFMTTTLASLATFILACYFLPVVLVSTPFLGFTFWFLRRRYVTASRQIKREEAITRSPIYATIPATLEGLSTVRAFGAESRFVENLVKLQNDNTRLAMLYLAVGKWLGMRLDLVSSLFSVLVVFTAVGISRVPSLQISSATVGLVLTYSLNLVGVMQWAFRQSAETENLMTAAERVIEYTKIPPERQPPSPMTPPSNWPSNGEIVVRDLTLNYPPSEKRVLKDVNFTIPGGSTVGIVGRTGSGKSSLLQALFRLVTPGGSISIDGVDTSKLGLSTLRSSMSIIPQDPFCFRGSVRFNLDPTSEHSDDALWAAIRSVQLHAMIDALPGKLDSFISENGGNWSVGERQLLCLARAILKASRVFVMDEATSAVDMNTDALINKVLRDADGAFKGVTTLTIAHRLNTVIDYDYILVLDDGKLVEFGEPASLLEKACDQEDAFFSRLVRDTGDESQQALTKLARDAALARKENPRDRAVTPVKVSTPKSEWASSQ
ncbi:hypothetical protein CcCBS67573_g04418 [Chytriomyces confervae]|uniref:Uncharacterized protein n=1 Tax=Chytriomyces confervae TaxID=246404 RepID=A0A507FDL5_9FUNG|nr:hypothetical protein CcCBS67573_g04418 [Chytriomyces confervae]